jgi:hypothetical protein
MKNKIVLFLVVPILFCWGAKIYAQSHDMILEPFSTSGQFLDDQIRADTTSTGARQDTERVYILRRGGVYYFNSQIVVDGYDLHMRAENGSGPRPMINNLENSTSGTYTSTMFEVRGNILDFSNLAIVNWDETQPSTLPDMGGIIVDGGGAGNTIMIDSCILKGGYSATVRANAAGKYFKLTNSIIANSGNGLRSNFGNGRSIDFRATSEDSVLIQNCTLVNITDRAVRHFGTSQAPISNFVFDHNTVINDQATHGCLGLGLVNGKFQVTNSLFVNNFIFGYDTASHIRAVEFQDSGELTPGTADIWRMTFIVTAPNSDSASATYDISNNYYSTSPEVKSMWANANPPVDYPLTPLTWYISKQLGADSSTAFVELQDTIAFQDVPNIPLNALAWYLNESLNPDRDKATTNFTADDDLDRRTLDYFNTTFNASYGTTSQAYTGAENGYPAGDLNWYPSLKSQWEQGVVLGIKDSKTLPTGFALDQNYPNPFNPSTKIAYNVSKLSKIRLDVYNILGEHVATIVNKVQPAGKYTVNFDASNLSSGVYIYRLSTGNHLFAKKMTLLK